MALPDRIIRSIRALRMPTVKQLLRTHAVLALRERLVLVSGILACAIGAILLVIGLYRAATVPAPAVGGMYVEGLVGNPHLVNPIFAPVNEVDRDLVRLLFSGLFTVDAEGRIIPDLAESYAVSDDGKTTTITLRSGARWHDGAEITVEDVLFTIRLLQDATVASPLRGAFRGVTAERVDERTVRFTIDRPFAVFANALTVGILPAHLWSEIPAAHLALAELNTRPIGSGPYQFIGLTKDKRGSIRSYTLGRYERYHHDAPFLERIAFRFYDDLDTALAAFDGRELDGIGTLSLLSDRALRRRDVARYPVPFPNTMAVFLNGRRNVVLRDREIRRALDRAIDRQAIVAMDLEGAGAAIGGPMIPGFLADAPPPEATVADPADAAERLDRLKWMRVEPEEFLRMRTQAELQKLAEEKRKALPVVRGKRAEAPPPTDEEQRTIAERVRQELAPCEECTPLPYVRMASGNVLTVAITTADRPELVTIANRIRAAWRAIGVRTTVIVEPLDRIRSDIIPTRAYDALLFSQTLGPDPDPFPFWHSSQSRPPGLNLTAFADKNADRLLEEARRTLDHAVRAQKYVAFQRLLAVDQPALFLLTPTYTYAVARNIRGIRINQLTEPADRFATVTDWYTETTRAFK